MRSNRHILLKDDVMGTTHKALICTRFVCIQEGSGVIQRRNVYLTALPYVTLRAHLTWPEPPDLAVVWVVVLALSRSPESVGLASDLFVLKRTQTTLLWALAVNAYEIK